MYAAITVIVLGLLAWDAYRRRDARLRWALTETNDYASKLVDELRSLQDFQAKQFEATVAVLAKSESEYVTKVKERDEWFANRLKVQEQALTEFLTQVREVVRFSEEARRSAQGAKIGAALK